MPANDIGISKPINCQQREKSEEWVMAGGGIADGMEKELSHNCGGVASRG